MSHLLVFSSTLRSLHNPFTTRMLLQLATDLQLLARFRPCAVEALAVQAHRLAEQIRESQANERVKRLD